MTTHTELPQEQEAQARREVATTWALRPTEGTYRECRAWENGYREALEAIDNALGTTFAFVPSEVL